MDTRQLTVMGISCGATPRVNAGPSEWFQVAAIAETTTADAWPTRQFGKLLTGSSQR